MKEAFPKGAIMGGFTSRINFVTADEPDRYIPYPVVSAENKLRRHKLIKDLNQISKLRGEFILSSGARQFYENEYRKFLNDNQFEGDKNLDGYIGRRHSMLLKLGMLVSASERDDLRIDLSDLQVAHTILRSSEQTLIKVTAAMTSETIGGDVESVINFIRKKGFVLKSEVVRRFRHSMPLSYLESVIDTLLSARMIVVDGYGRDVTLVYRDTKKQAPLNIPTGPAGEERKKEEPDIITKLSS
jgi:hypothetical protein